MTRVLLKKLLLAGSYFVAAFLAETITFLFMGFGGAAEYVLLDIACILLLASVVYIIPSFRVQAGVIVLLLAGQCLLSVVNQLLYDMSGFVFIISMVAIADDALGAFNIDYLNFYLIGVFVVLILAELACLIAVCRRFKVKEAHRGNTVVLVLFLALLVSGLSECLYFGTKSSFMRADTSDPMYIYKDDSYLYDTQFISAKAFKKFGTFSFYYKNVANFIASVGGSEPTDEDITEQVEELDTYFSGGSFASGREDLDLSAYGGNDQILTGMLEGQNVVLIVIESGEWYGLNRTYTPTLYALANNGVAMTNYITRDKTNHSEAMSVFGSYPSEDRNSVSDLLDNDLAFALPFIMQRAGYTTNYFHTGNREYYSRNETFGGGVYGFEHASFADTLEKMNGYYDKTGFYDFDRDSEMISQHFDEFTRVDEGDGAFYTQMMTLISHGSYNDLINYGDYSADWTEEEKAAFEEECTVKELGVYYERINDYPSEESVIDEKFALTANKYEQDIGTGERTETPTDVYLRYKRYQAGLMDLDVGVNRLLHELSESGELSNTTFFVYADHNCYYTDQSYSLKNVAEDQAWNLKLYNIPFFFWSGKYMDLEVQTDLYEGVQYVKDDLTPEMMEQSGLTQSDFYSGQFYYELSHDAPDDGYSFLRGCKLTKFCNSFDVLPTILDLFGYDYNTLLYQGVSLFDAEESVFVSRESGMYNGHMYTEGMRLYIEAERLENGSVQSFNGDVLFFVNSDGREYVTVRNELGSIRYVAEEVEKYISVLDGLAEVETDPAPLSQDYVYIVYDLEAIFAATDMDGKEDRRELLSGSVYDFMVDLSGYYERQQPLEEMYYLDYFRYADIGALVFKIE